MFCDAPIKISLSFCPLKPTVRGVCVSEQRMVGIQFYMVIFRCLSDCDFQLVATRQSLLDCHYQAVTVQLHHVLALNTHHSQRISLQVRPSKRPLLSSGRTSLDDQHSPQLYRRSQLSFFNTKTTKHISQPKS